MFSALAANCHLNSPASQLSAFWKRMKYQRWSLREKITLGHLARTPFFLDTFFPPKSLGDFSLHFFLARENWTLETYFREEECDKTEGKNWNKSWEIKIVQNASEPHRRKNGYGTKPAKRDLKRNARDDQVVYSWTFRIRKAPLLSLIWLISSIYIFTWFIISRAVSCRT